MTPRTALVTGASRGIGAAIAARLEADGHRVLTPSHGQLDLADDASVDAWLAALDEPVDILVNNAGINPLAAGTEVTDEQLYDTLRINLISPARLTRVLGAGMAERGWGRIVNISSIWGTVTKPQRFAYTMSKSAIDGMTRSLAVELGPQGVLVNAVAPGFVDTELTRKNNPPEVLAQLAAALPLRRMGTPEEIAELVAFLGTERNSFVTGQVLIADGGYTCL